MTATIQTELGSGIFEVHLSGKLTKADYEAFVPQVERYLEESGKLRLLVVLENFQGWRAGALWEDVKFGLKHFADIRRLAFVGDKKWQEGMALFCKPFTKAEVRYFEKGRLDEARRWLAGEDAEQG